MIRRPPRPPIKMMQPIALDLANSVTLLASAADIASLMICRKNAIVLDHFLIHYSDAKYFYCERVRIIEWPCMKSLALLSAQITKRIHTDQISKSHMCAIML